MAAQTPVSSAQEIVPQAASQPFPFLKLPKELRLMVYERLSREAKNLNLAADMGNYRNEADLCSNLTLLHPRTHTSILATCKLINDEATPFVRRTIESFILAKPPRALGSTTHASLRIFELVFAVVLVQSYAWNTTGCFRTLNEIRHKVKRMTGHFSADQLRESMPRIQAFATTVARQLAYRHVALLRTGQAVDPMPLYIELLYNYFDSFRPGALSPTDQLRYRAEYTLRFNLFNNFDKGTILAEGMNVGITLAGQ